MNKKYRVVLAPEQRQTLESLIHTGSAPAQTQSHARILLKADCGGDGAAWADAAIAQACDVSIEKGQELPYQEYRYSNGGSDDDTRQKIGAQPAHQARALECLDTPGGRIGPSRLGLILVCLSALCRHPLSDSVDFESCCTLEQGRSAATSAPPAPLTNRHEAMARPALPLMVAHNSNRGRLRFCAQRP